MKTILAAAAAIGACAVGAPAWAEHAAPVRYELHGQFDGAWRDRVRTVRSIDLRQRDIERRIVREERNGALSRREAGRLKTAHGQIAELEWRYARDGLTRLEIRDLLARLDRLNRVLVAEARDRNNYRG